MAIGWIIWWPTVESDQEKFTLDSEILNMGLEKKYDFELSTLGKSWVHLD